MDISTVQRSDRVRKRASNACSRCRKQKIKCSGTQPCIQCNKRNQTCVFDTRQTKVLVSQRYLAELERQVASLSSNRNGSLNDLDFDEDQTYSDDEGEAVNLRGASSPPNRHDAVSETDETNHQGVRATPESDLHNPLDPTISNAFTVDTGSKHFFLGVTSNWAFGRRVLKMVYEKVNGIALPPASLLFEGATYDLGWDGQRTGGMTIDTTSLPTSDFALFLVNSVKFHCGHLFHMFDETTFMESFSRFYEDPGKKDSNFALWYIHFLLILAFGKAFIVRASKDKRPPGAELFAQAMRLLPDITFLYTDPIQSVEILCCAALYLQCLDLRSAAYNVIGQALRLAVEQGIHTNMQGHHLSEHMVERCKETWWTVYILDRQMTSLMGVPISLSDDDITAPLPFAGSAKKKLALSLHIKLSKAIAIILQTVYARTGGARKERLLVSMKEALKSIAEANDERNEFFPLDLDKSTSGICRLSAYLHIFHHQSLILATRPLLYSFLQSRLAASKPLRVSSTRGARYFLRVCVDAAQQSLSILEALQSQGLLEYFVPFDREATFSSAVVLVIAEAVDPSLLRDDGPKLTVAFSILDEMIGRGNRIAEYHKHELEQLDLNMQKLCALQRPETNMVQQNESGITPTSTRNHGADDLSRVDSNTHTVDTVLSGWSSEDSFSGDQLMAVADSLDFNQLDWLISGDIERPFGMGFG